MCLRQVGGQEQPLDPVDLVDAFGEVVGKAEPLADLVEDPIVGARLAERFDRRRLEDDDAVIELLLAVMAVAAEPRPFADVDPLEIGAGGQNDVGEFRLALEPDRLVDDEFQVRRLVHPHVAVGVVHRREDRAAVLVHHAHRRMARAPDRRIWRTGARSICRSTDSLPPCRRRSPPAWRCAECAGRSCSWSAAAACADRARPASRCFPDRPTCRRRRSRGNRN